MSAIQRQSSTDSLEGVMTGVKGLMTDTKVVDPFERFVGECTFSRTILTFRGTSPFSSVEDAMFGVFKNDTNHFDVGKFYTV
jgi:hypothetical protein